MKVVLCAVNSSYIHKNLAVLKLSKYIKRDLKVLEFTVNQPRDFVYNELLKENAQVYCFSCYIWNVSYIKVIAERLKKATGAKIIFGGPEASGEADKFSLENPYIDYVIKGEGELALDYLLNSIEKGEEISMEGIYQNGKGKGVAPILKECPTPYNSEDLGNKDDFLIYYETSRGCFNKCAYCISSNEKCHLYDVEKVKSDISHMVTHGIKLIKLVDRSFNANGKRSLSLLSFLAKETKDTSFHLEVAPDLFTKEMLEIIKNAPFGKFQFEAGIQSLNEETLKAIDRACNNEKGFSNLRAIISFGNCYVHTDIIAGLPFEDKESFIDTFNKVYSLSAYRMDVGFLKVLKGTKIRSDAEKYEIVYENEPPYEVIKTKWLSAFDLLEIKKVHNALSRVYNSHGFCHFVRFIEEKNKSPYDTYLSLGNAIKEGMSKKALFEALIKAYPEGKKQLIMDFMISGEKSVPQGFDVIEISKFSEKCISFIGENIDLYFPHLKDIHPAAAFKKLKFYAFPEGVFMALRGSDKVYDITEKINL